MTEPKRYRSKETGQDVFVLHNKDGSFTVLKPEAVIGEWHMNRFFEPSEPVPSTLRPEIMEFAEAMEAQIRPCERGTWKRDSIASLCDQMKIEVETFSLMNSRGDMHERLLRIATWCWMIDHRLKEEDQSAK